MLTNENWDGELSAPLRHGSGVVGRYEPLPDGMSRQKLLCYALEVQNADGSAGSLGVGWLPDLFTTAAVHAGGELAWTWGEAGEFPMEAAGKDGRTYIIHAAQCVFVRPARK